MTQATFDAVLDACYGLPTGIEAEAVTVPPGRCRDIEVRLANQIGRGTATVRIGPTADPSEVKALLDEAVASILGRSPQSQSTPARSARPVRPH